LLTLAGDGDGDRSGALLVGGESALAGALAGASRDSGSARCGLGLSLLFFSSTPLT